MITATTTTTGTQIVTTSKSLDDEALVCCSLEQLQDDRGVIDTVLVKVMADTCTVVVTVVTDIFSGMSAHDIGSLALVMVSITDTSSDA